MTDERRSPWSTTADGRAWLQGVRCDACGLVAFPKQDYGCIRCGAHGAALREEQIAAEGTLTSFAVVRNHQSHAVPFTLGEIQLSAGPVVRALLAEAEPHAPGERYVGREIDDGGKPALEFFAEAAR